MPGAALLGLGANSYGRRASLLGLGRDTGGTHLTPRSVLSAAAHRRDTLDKNSSVCGCIGKETEREIERESVSANRKTKRVFVCV